VAPQVEATLLKADREGRPLRAWFVVAMRQLATNGLRAPSARKFKGLDIWEVRVGDHRAFLRPVSGTHTIGVGALLPKRTQRIRMDRLKLIERQVDEWSCELEDDG
jgi:hypothetical protein